MVSWSHWNWMICWFGFLVSGFRMFGCGMVFILQMVEGQGMSIFVHVIPMHRESKNHFHTERVSMEIFVNKCGRRMISFGGCGFMICGRWRCGWMVCGIWWSIIWSWRSIISQVENFFQSTSIFRWRIPL